MERGTYSSLFYIILLFSVIAGCAKINSPSGGPKDKLPPFVVKSIPENGTKNFTGNKISITFDEYFVLDKINEKFMVSPPMTKKPLVEIKGKNLIIEYEDKLHDSTTYTFYFQDAVRDLNEGNILDNYQFVFSTGPVIDSLSVTGNVYNAFTLNAPENALVLLYRDPDFFNVTKQLPDYISKADQNGYFRIDNVREGKYLLYALKDEDNSKNFNLPDEEFAFLDNPVDITVGKNYSPVKPDTLKPKQVKTSMPDTAIKKGEYKLILFKPEKKQRYLTSSLRNLPYHLIYTLSLPPGDMDFTFSIPGTDIKSYFIEKSREKDTVQVWITDSILYSQQQITTMIKYPFTDTTGKVFQKEDTVLMRFLAPRTTRTRAKPVPFKVSTNLTGGIIKPGYNAVFKSQTPFRIPDTSRIRLYETEGSKKGKIPFSFLRDSTSSCRIIMMARFDPGKKYLFIADSAAFGSLYGEQSDSTGITFSAGKNENYGKLMLNISNYEGSRIIQVLNNNEQILRQAVMQKNGKIEFPLLDQGKYRLRIIYDLNNDGKWTTGDYSTRKQPEPVSFYWQELEIKENLWLDQDWNVSQMNVKKLKSTSTRSNTR
jgi:uncharacterized protein (DUF2141 family)